VVDLPDDSGPPADADDWTDEEWLAWLNANEEPSDAPGPRGPSREERPVLPQQLLAAAMKGMYRAIYGGEDDEVVEVAEASGDPPGPEPVELHLDPDHPDESVVIIRPWLMEGERE
jgi:hypothetical protein